MNRSERRRHNAQMRKLPKSLAPVPESEWPKGHSTAERVAVWRSRKYLVQVFAEGGHVRLTVSRVMVGKDGGWNDDISWDELQSIKHEVGFGKEWAVEVFPPDRDVVNVANMRHLWLLLEPPAFGWRNG